MIKKIKKTLKEDEPDKPKREPSGFAKPTTVSKELLEFLGESEGTLVARTDVTKRILKYVTDNDLQNKEQKRKINLDAKLKNLLKPAENEEVTYFTLQRLLKPHYVKTDSTVKQEIPITPPIIETKPKKTRAKKT
eukprot:gene1113-1667_t